MNLYRVISTLFTGQISQQEVDAIFMDATLLAAALVYAGKGEGLLDHRVDFCIQDAGYFIGPAIEIEAVLIQKSHIDEFEETPNTEEISDHLNAFLAEQIKKVRSDQFFFSLLNHDFPRHRQISFSPADFSAHQRLKALSCHTKQLELK